VVIGGADGRGDDAVIGEKVGNMTAPRSDIAVDPLEGTGSAPRTAGLDRDTGDGRRGTLLHAPTA